MPRGAARLLRRAAPARSCTSPSPARCCSRGTALERTPGEAAAAPRAERAADRHHGRARAALECDFASAGAAPPSAPERTALLEQAVQEEMLYREARVLALGFDDASVRRRLIEKMRALGERPAATRTRWSPRRSRSASTTTWSSAGCSPRRCASSCSATRRASPIGDDVLAAILERDRARFVQPETITLQQVFLSSDVRGDAAARDARTLLAELRAGTLDVAAARRRAPMRCRSRGALHAQPRLKLQARFGKAFADEVFALDAGAWSGPIASPFGLHLVRVVEKQPERLPALDEVRPALIESLRRERAQANLARGLARLRGLYEVRIETETATTQGERRAPRRDQPRWRIPAASTRSLDDAPESRPGRGPHPRRERGRTGGVEVGMWMTPDPVTVEPGARVSEVARLMALRHVRRVVGHRPGLARAEGARHRELARRVAGVSARLPPAVGERVAGRRRPRGRHHHVDVGARHHPRHPDRGRRGHAPQVQGRRAAGGARRPPGRHHHRERPARRAGRDDRRRTSPGSA